VYARGRPRATAFARAADGARCARSALALSRSLLCALVALAVVGTAAGARAEAAQPVPPLAARVTDLTGTLGAGARAALEAKLEAFEKRKGAQVAVLVVATTQPETVEQYGIRVASAWKLGREGVDDGALLLVAKDDRALRIEVGYGLEGALTDALSNRIIDQWIVPRFRAGDFAGGIEAGVDALLRAIDGEPLPAPEPEWTPGPISAFERLLPFAVVGLPVGAAVLNRAFGGFVGSLVAGGVVFALIWLFTRAFWIALGFALFAAILTALYGRQRSWSRSGPGGHVWRGGGGGFAGRGGGGFGGGGGRFGGGGASGRW
jgi:uncharacterized protein